MKLYLESDLAFDPATAWEIFESSEYADRLEDATDMSVELLEERMEGDVKVRKLRYRSKRELPRMVAKALGSKNLTYEQVNRFDRNRSELTWQVFLPVVADRVTVEGTTRISEAPGGAKRVVDGDIEVRVRLVGGQIEKVVAGEFERSMGRAVDLAKEIYAERNA
ncbi:MAG: DUF2505 family protein [Deltaproteobacteria bacterium]|nr:MAG: DUF2505 family protein [Deltaproteobacteria bacterium]